MKWWQYLFGHKKRIAEYNRQMAEIEYRRERLRLAHKLHMDVLENYGLFAYIHLADMDVIINDTKKITVINYLDI